MRTPQVIMTGAIVGSVLLLGVYFTQAVYPALAISRAENMEIKVLESQRAVLEQTPVPVKVRDAEVAALLQRVPTQPEIPRFLYELLNAEGDSGVVMQSYSTGAQTRNVEGRTVIDTQTNTVQTQAAQPSAVQGNGLVELNVNLTVSGTYAGLQQFLGKLQQSERLVSVNSWVMTANQERAKAVSVPGQTAASVSEVFGAGEAASVAVHRMELQLSLYAAPAYESKLGTLEAMPAQAPDARVDPTLTDQVFYPLLTPVP